MFRRIQQIVNRHLETLKSIKSKSQILKLVALNTPLFKTIMNDILKDNTLINKRFEILVEIIQHSIAKQLSYQ